MNSQHILARLAASLLLLPLPACSAKPFQWTLPERPSETTAHATIALLSSDFHHERMAGNDFYSAFPPHTRHADLFDMVAAEQQRWIESRNWESALWNDNARFLGTRGDLFVLYPPTRALIDQRWAGQSYARGTPQETSLFIWAPCAAEQTMRWHHIKAQLPIGDIALSGENDQYLIISWRLPHPELPTYQPALSVHRIHPDALQPMRLPPNLAFSSMAISASRWAGHDTHHAHFGDVHADRLETTSSIPYDASDLTWSRMWITPDGDAAIFGNFDIVHRNGTIRSLLDIDGEAYLANPPDPDGVVHTIAYGSFDDHHGRETRLVNIDLRAKAVTLPAIALPPDARAATVSPCGTIIIADAESQLTPSERSVMHPPKAWFHVVDANDVRYITATNRSPNSWFPPVSQRSP
ncbi:MAG: hypothetical protein ACTS3F_12365 [Phycisphaerales bacterium]